MKISWADVGRTETPGSFRLFNGLVEVKQQHIAVWKAEPTALYTLIPFKGIGDEVQRYALGTYEVPDEDF
jgi:hypothetical protein